MLAAHLLHTQVISRKRIAVCASVCAVAATAIAAEVLLLLTE